VQKALHMSLGSVSGLIGIDLIEPNDERTITDQPSVVRKGVSPVDENIANDGLQGHASNRRHITN